MKKIYVAILIASMLVFTGCGTTTSSRQEPTQPVQPVQPEPKPDPEPESPTIPTSGIGSIKANMDCSGGTITTNYSFAGVDEDDKNFVLQYERNGALEDLTYPSTSTTGSRMIVKDIYYARANDGENPVYWVVTISFQAPDETYNLVTTTLVQPPCDDNATAVTTSYEVK